MPNSPNWQQGYVPSNGEWNANFAEKLDQTGNSAGAPMAGPLWLNADPSPGGANAATANYVDLVTTSLGYESYDRAQGDILIAAQAAENVGRNVLLNPLITVATRGAGPFTVAGYSLDGFYIGCGSGGSRSVTPNIVTIGALGDESAHTVLQYQFVGGTGASDCEYISRPIENVLRLTNQTYTWQAIMKSASGALQLGFEVVLNFGTGGTPTNRVTGVATQAITIASGWALYTFTAAIPSAVGDTVGTNLDSWAEVRYWLSAGSSLNSRASGIGVQTDTLAMWGDQFEANSLRTALEKRDPGLEARMCGRWLRRIGAMVINGSVSAGVSTTYVPLTFESMRVVPTPQSVTWGASTNVTTQGIANVTVTSCQPYLTGTTVGVAASTLQGMYLSAEPVITT